MPRSMLFLLSSVIYDLSLQALQAWTIFAAEKAKFAFDYIQKKCFNSVKELLKGWRGSVIKKM